MPISLDVKKTVKKSNILNELRNANTSMAEYRLFCVYLAHLPMDSDSNVVTFTLADYARIAGLDRPRYVDIKAQAENIVSRVASLPNEDGGFSTYSLFTEFKLHKKDEQWMVSLECNSRIAPMIREQRGRFLRYKLYNTVRLKSYNQQRIYELLKQYERIGVRIIDLSELRGFLSISDDEYPVWGVFARDVLKVAQKALKEHTDICFDFEPVKKGRKVTAVKFTIQKNESFVDQLELDDFLPPAEVEYDGDDFEVESQELDDQAPADDPEEENFFAGALPEDFTAAQVEAIRLAAWDKVPFDPCGAKPHDVLVYDYIEKKVALMRASRDPIRNPYRWILSAIEGDYR